MTMSGLADIWSPGTSRKGPMLFKRFRKKPNDPTQDSPQDPSIITRDVMIDGSIVSRGTIHVEGTVHGDVRSQTCVVDSDGVVEGEVVAENVYVRGRIIGPIRGVHVHLYAGAHVEGDILNETVSIENGAYVYGSVRRSDDPLGDGLPASSGQDGDNKPGPLNLLRPR